MTLAKAKPRRAAEIENVAYALLQKFYPDSLKNVRSIDVEELFLENLQDDIGIKPAFWSLPDGCDGLTHAGNRTCYISKSLADHHDSDDVRRRRYRSTIAHELGHCYLHVQEATNNAHFQQSFSNVSGMPVSTRFATMEIYEDPEWQAWRFASALLMPEELFRRAVSSNFTKKQIKNAFDVNPSFVNVRLKQLRITKLIVAG